MFETEVLENISLFIKQNWLILLLLLGLIFIVIYNITKTLKSLFLGIKCIDRIFLFLSILGFFGQIVLFKNKFFEIALQLTLIINILLFWLFINRNKINNDEFNAVVLIFLVGMSAYCMIISGQKELYDHDVFHSIVYAGIYIGIPMFVAYKFTSKEKEVNNKEDIYKKLEEIENKLKKIDSSINKSYKSGCSMLSIFKRFK